jgi:uncharacterized membrane protein YfcA
MSIEIYLTFLMIVGVSTYFQTVTGFGLGMIVMGAVSGLDLMPVAIIAAINSILSLVNSMFALPGAWHHVNWRLTRVVLFGMLPSTIVGVMALHYLGSTYSTFIKLLLGISIIFGGINIAATARPDKQRSKRSGFFISGILSGTLDGLFGLAGPPLVYQFYRQCLSVPTIRYSLIFLFGASAASRTVIVAAQSQLTYQVMMLSVLSLPVGALATVFAKRYPPPLTEAGMRRFASIILIGIGLSLILRVIDSWARTL